jgi:hypothetical protein
LRIGKHPKSAIRNPKSAICWREAHGGQYG